MNATTKQISHLCQSCGMCCDGTLFGKANIRDKDESDRIKALGMSVFQQGEKRFFAQPCPQHNVNCVVYQSLPSVCRSYYCKPLRKQRWGRLSFAEAENAIKQAISLRQLILAARAANPEFSGKSVFEIKQYLNQTDRPHSEQVLLRKKYAELCLAVKKLELLLIGNPKLKQDQPSS